MTDDEFGQLLDAVEAAAKRFAEIDADLPLVSSRVVD